MCLSFWNDVRRSGLLFEVAILGRLWMIGKCVCNVKVAQTCFLDVARRSMKAFGVL